MDLTEEKLKIAEEANELGEFLAELEKRPPEESKMTYLVSEIDDAFKSGHETVIIFTQYTDTMDYLRNQLIPWYGSKVVCYSGAGGERWDDGNKTWIRLSKTEVKNLFREGREVKILIGTDSLSEGLNLQTCGKLINYDMPWNFMRVEQRIGRVDRINGQPIVEVSNYFYQGTVEEQIYSGIADDYDWFTDIVGPAQPVLGRVVRHLVDGQHPAGAYDLVWDGKDDQGREVAAAVYMTRIETQAGVQDGKVGGGQMTVSARYVRGGGGWKRSHGRPYLGTVQPVKAAIRPVRVRPRCRSRDAV